MAAAAEIIAQEVQVRIDEAAKANAGLAIDSLQNKIPVGIDGTLVCDSRFLLVAGVLGLTPSGNSIYTDSVFIGASIVDGSEQRIPVSNGTVVFDLDDNAHLVLWTEDVHTTAIDAADGSFTVKGKLVLRVVDATIGGTQARRVIKFNSRGHSSTMDPDDVTAIQRAPDNTASGEELFNQMKTQEFKAKFPCFLGVGDPFAIMEHLRTSSAAGSEDARKKNFIHDHVSILTAAFVSPFYPGRSAATNAKAQSLLKAIGVIGRTVYECLNKKTPLLLNEAETEALAKHINLVPFEITALSAELTASFKASGSEVGARSARINNEAERKKKNRNKKATAEGRDLATDLTTPSPERKKRKSANDAGDYFGKGKFSKAGNPMRKQGRPPGTKVTQGKARPPPGWERPSPISVRSSGSEIADRGGNAEFRDRVAFLERELQEQKEICTRMQKDKAELITEFRVKEVKYIAELEKRSAIASFMASSSSTTIPPNLFKDVSPMKIPR